MKERKASGSTGTFWQSHTVGGTTENNPSDPKPGGKAPGLVARENQLADAKKDRSMQGEARDTQRGAQGSVSTRLAVGVAQRALKRQQQYAKGEYPSGQ